MIVNFKKLTLFIFALMQFYFVKGQEMKIDSINKIVEQQIQEVEINSKKKLIERKVDRLVFNVENSISATGGDALDALRVTPSIRVQNDQISMIGKSGMAIMIDDKLIQLSEDDLMNFLKTIKSDDIKSIEVITTPPAKYDAEGNSGIVNIKLKKAKKDSISGNLKTSYTQAKYPLGNFGAGFNYQKNKLTLITNANYENGSIAPFQEYTLYYPNYTWLEKNTTRSFRNTLSGRVALDYQLSPKTTMGIQYSGAWNKPIRKGNNTSYITNHNTNQLDSLIITPSRIETDRKTHSLNFHSITKVDTIGTQYSIDVDYFKFGSNLDNKFSTDTYSPNGVSIPNHFISANNLSNQRIDIYSAKFDYDLPLKWINISLGGKLSFINNNSQVSYFDTTNTNPVLDISKSNVFNYKENTQAIYISGSKNLSRKWDLQLGIRLENTQTKGYSQTLNLTNDNSYLKLFPTFYLTYKFNEDNTLGFNYNKRIDRPTYSDLNPFRFYSSKYNYSEGNPFLQPYFTDNLEFSFIHKNSFTSLYASYIKNGFDQVTIVSENNPIQVVSSFNFFKQINTGLLESYTLSKWDWLESNNQATLFYTKTISSLKYISPNIGSWTFSFNTDNSFILNKSKTLRAELSFVYQSSSITNSYKLSSFYYINTGFKVLLLEKKLQIAINAMDIFRTKKMTFTQIVSGIKEDNKDYRDTQKIVLSLIWSFGKSLKNQQRKLSNEDEKIRVN